MARATTKKTAKPKPLSLDRQIGDLSNTNLTCRYPNHHWVRQRVYHIFLDRRKYVAVDFLCQCAAERRDVLTLTAERVSSKVIYPDGYLIKGHGRVDRQAFRLETIDRFLKPAKSSR